MKGQVQSFRGGGMAPPGSPLRYGLLAVSNSPTKYWANRRYSTVAVIYPTGGGGSAGVHLYPILSQAPSTSQRNFGGLGRGCLGGWTSVGVRTMSISRELH